MPQNDQELQKRIEGIIEEVMGVSLKKLPPDEKLSKIPAWDSFNNLMLISRLQEEFDVEFSTKEIEETQTIRQIFSLVKSKIK